MKYLSTCILMLLLSISATAQYNFQPGYIVKNNGDTVRGEINYREWKKNPESIQFRAGSANGIYKAADISAFEVNDYEKYISYKLAISLAKTSFPDLTVGGDTSSTVRTIFMKVLTEGEFVTLLEYTDDIKVRYFTREQHDQPVELKYNLYYKTQSRTETVTAEVYKGQLSILAQKYAADQSLSTKINSANYNADALTKIIRLINRAQDKDKKKVSHIRFIAGAGLNFTNTRFSGDNIFASSPDAKQTTPVFNAGIDFLNNPHIEHLILRGEFSATYIKPRFEAKGQLNSQHHYSFNQSTFTFNPQVIYNVYNTNALKFYLDAGLGINYSSYSNNHYTITDNSSAATQLPLSFQSAWVTFPVGAGLTINRQLEIAARYIAPSDYTAYNNYNVRSSQFQIRLYWLFDKHY